MMRRMMINMAVLNNVPLNKSILTMNYSFILMNNWTCYLLRSLDSNKTYIGSTNDISRRLKDHNSRQKSRRGAKYTCHETWVPIMFISGFEDKKACLSFESGWKRLAKGRNNSRFEIINCIYDKHFKYSKSCQFNRILDLLFFVHNFTYLGTHFVLNRDMKHPIICPNELTINILLETWIGELPWPYFLGRPINSTV